MSPVYDAPITLSELGSSDHNIVLLRSTHGHYLEKGSPVRVTIRCMSSDNRAKFSAMLSAVRWRLCLGYDHVKSNSLFIKQLLIK